MARVTTSAYFGRTLSHLSTVPRHFLVAIVALAFLGMAGIVVQAVNVPTVQITSPANGTFCYSINSVTGTLVDHSGSGMKRAELSIQRVQDGKYWNGTAVVWQTTQAFLVTTAVTGGTFTFNQSLPGGTNLVEGNYILTVRGVDNAGGVGSASVTITVNKTPPTGTFTTPTNNAYVNALTLITMTAADTPNGSGMSGVSVQIQRVSDGRNWDASVSKWQNLGHYIDSTLVGGQWTITTSANLPSGANLPAGSYKLMASVRDCVNNASLPFIIIHVDKTVPTVSISTPAAGATLPSLTQLAGTAADNTGGAGIDYVEVQLVRSSDSKYWDGATSTWTAVPKGVVA